MHKYVDIYMCACLYSPFLMEKMIKNSEQKKYCYFNSNKLSKMNKNEFIDGHDIYIVHLYFNYMNSNYQ